MGLLRILMKLAGIATIPIGIVFTLAGAYGLAGGTGITFEINERVVSPQEGGMIFSISGMIVLLVGVSMIYLARDVRLIPPHAPLTTTGKIEIILMVSSIIFLAVYALFFPVIYSFAKSTPERWFILQKFFVVTLILSIVTVINIPLRLLLSRFR